MLVLNKNRQEYKELVISFIAFFFAFKEGVTIIDCPANMKLYVYDIEESDKETIIGCLGYLGTADVLLHIVQCWIACEVNE